MNNVDNMTETEEPRYRVVLIGGILHERSRDEVLEGLAGLFKSTTTAMERVLQGRPTPLKKEYSKSQASKLCRKIQGLGAQCKIEEIRVEKAVAGAVSEATCESSGHDRETVVDDRPDSSSDGIGPEKIRDLVTRFVCVNTDYYLRQFARFGDPRHPSFRLSWHWPAFFFFFLWALYRKMWGMAALYIIVGSAITNLTGNSPGAIFSLIWLIFWPCVANWLYYRKVIAGIHRVLENPGLEDDCLRSAGVSKGMVWMGVVIMIVLSLWAGNHLARQFAEEYKEELAGVLPGSGTQVTRDGDIVNVNPQSGSGLVESSLTLSYLATTLKLLMVAKGDMDNNASVTEFIEKLGRGEYTDGWGNEILVTQEVDRYVLSSAGPDQTHGTGDDILQAVNLR